MLRQEENDGSAAEAATENNRGQRIAGSGAGQDYEAGISHEVEEMDQLVVDYALNALRGLWGVTLPLDKDFHWRGRLAPCPRSQSASHAQDSPTSFPHGST